MLEDFCLLLHIATKGIFNEIHTSTGQIAKKLNCSQQTISRRLKELEQKKLIEKKSSKRGVTIKLTEEGRKTLREKFIELKKICQKPQIKIKGKITPGIGEGAYYIKQYSKKIKEILGYTPFPGTLNIKLNKNHRTEFLSQINPVEIKAFKKKDRTFGAIKCYNIKINNKPCTAIIPERTQYKENIIEIICPDNLRKKLKLKNETEVELSYLEE